MKTVGILGGTMEFLDRLHQILSQAQLKDMEFLIGQTAAQLQQDRKLDLLAVYPGTRVATKEQLPSCHLLLLPGSEAVCVQQCEASCAMSYGTSSKDSLTVSSMEDQHIALAVQRELVTLTGGTVDRQELILSVRDGSHPMPLLFWAGLLLVLGSSPDELPALIEEKLISKIKPGI